MVFAAVSVALRTVLTRIGKSGRGILGGGVAGGTIGGTKVGAFTAIPNPAMIPFQIYMNAVSAVTFGSMFIIGERLAYNEMWPKIKARIDRGEQRADAVNAEVGPFISGIAEGGSGLLDLVGDLLNLENDEAVRPDPSGAVHITQQDVQSLSDKLLTYYYKMITTGEDPQKINIVLTNATSNFINDEMFKRKLPPFDKGAGPIPPTEEGNLGPPHIPPKEPNVPLEEILQHESWQSWVKTISSVTYPGLTPDVYRNLSTVTVKRTNWWNYINSEWQTRQSYLLSVTKSGGSVNSPQYVKILAQKRVLEQIIADANALLAKLTAK